MSDMMPMLINARFIQANELADVAWLGIPLFYLESFDIEFIDQSYAPFDLIIANSDYVFAMKSSILFYSPYNNRPLVRIALI